MAVRIRRDGRILCAAMHGPQPGDAYLDDGIHYYLSVEKKVLVTEIAARHRQHGQWWWAGQVPEGAQVDPFYREESQEDDC